MTDGATLEEIRSLPWGELETSGAMYAVLELAEHDDLSHIVNSLINVDRDLLPATLTAHVKRRQPELLKQHAGRKASSSAAPRKSQEDVASFDEVTGLCLEREEYRKNSNYGEADRVRNLLQSMNVSLDDKRHMFTMPDGKQGSYDLHQGAPPPAPATQRAAPAPPRDAQAQSPRNATASSGRAPLPPVVQVSHRGFASALEACMEREQVRKDGDYSRADSLRDELAARGVTLEDKQHLFTMKSGLQGTYSLRRGIGIHEVRLCCLDREEARRDNDYREADQIRGQLTSIGIDLDDKTHTFTMQDGQRGSYDLHIAAPAGPSASWGPPPSAPPGLPPPHRGNHMAAPARDGGFAGIERQCLDRERARRDGDYKTADRLRDHLGSIGVQLEDKTHMFTTPDGRTGTYDLHRHESGASQQAPPPPHYAHPHYAQAQYPPQYMQPQYAQPQYSQPPPPQYMQPHHGQARQAPITGGSAYAAQPPSGSGSSGYSGYLNALQTTRQREEVRRNRDYREADRLRDNLKRMGVECEDASHRFTLRGLEGSYDLHHQLDLKEAQCIALEREEARKGRDYSRGDSIRDWLVTQGVQLEDKTHTFTMSDGASGTYDLHLVQSEERNGHNDQASKRRRT